MSWDSFLEGRDEGVGPPMDGIARRADRLSIRALIASPVPMPTGRAILAKVLN